MRWRCASLAAMLTAVAVMAKQQNPATFAEIAQHRPVFVAEPELAGLACSLSFGPMPAAFDLNKSARVASDGRVAEWFKAPVLKTGVPARVP